MFLLKLYFKRVAAILPAILQVQVVVHWKLQVGHTLTVGKAFLY